MDELVARLMDHTRSTLREHADKVEALVGALLEREELDAETVAEILGKRPAAVGTRVATDASPREAQGGNNRQEEDQ